jgi:hypothetical protein
VIDEMDKDIPIKMSLDQQRKFEHKVCVQRYKSKCIERDKRHFDEVMDRINKRVKESPTGAHC